MKTSIIGHLFVLMGTVAMIGAIALLSTKMVTAAMSTADESCRFSEATPAREPGVRLRLFCIEVPLQRMPQLVPDQSPNLDRTIHELVLDGREEYLSDYPGRYFAILTTSLQLDDAGEYRFELASDCLATLRVAFGSEGMPQDERGQVETTQDTSEVRSSGGTSLD
ncbi:MAG: hypothetical protein WD468_11035 [Pirellulales bacterium]